MFIFIIWNYKTKVKQLLKIMSTNSFLILTKFLVFWHWVSHFVFYLPTPGASLPECNYIFWDLLGNAVFAFVGDWLTCARGVGWVCGVGVFFLVWGECVVCCECRVLRFNFGASLVCIFHIDFGWIFLIRFSVGCPSGLCNRLRTFSRLKLFSSSSSSSSSSSFVLFCNYI